MKLLLYAVTIVSAIVATPAFAESSKLAPQGVSVANFFGSLFELKHR